jgi:hypothetical protein
MHLNGDGRASLDDTLSAYWARVDIASKVIRGNVGDRRVGLRYPSTLRTVKRKLAAKIYNSLRLGEDLSYLLRQPTVPERWHGRLQSR